MALLAKLADLKTLLEISGTAQDDLLSLLLAEVTAQIEQHCGREFLYAAADRTEYFDGGELDLRLAVWPVAGYLAGGSLARPVVKIAFDYAFDVMPASVENLDYVVRWKRGILTRLPDETCWPAGPGRIQVVYRGGYNDPSALPVDGMDYVPPHVQQACLAQCEYLFSRHRERGPTNFSMPGGAGGAGFSQAYDLLPSVKKQLRIEVRV